MTAYLRNIWYLAAWADEVPAGGTLARRLLDEPVVIARDSEGRPFALYDRCPHRFVPLSKGHVNENGLACGYHGLVFGANGRCVLNPHGPISSAMNIRSFPMLEAHRALWIWMGDPEKASPDLLPNLQFVSDAPDTAFSKGYIWGKGHYELYIDNILDLTHADFLHPDTLGGGAFTRTRPKIWDRPDGMSVYWLCDNEVPSPVLRGVTGLHEASARVDSWTELDWYPPSILTLRSGAVPTGTSRANAGNVMNLHVMTPETNFSTHYFFAATRDFALDDREFNERFAANRAHIFSAEDNPMIEAQQRGMEGKDFWDMKPLMFKSDEGAVRVRRKLTGLIEAEQAERVEVTA